MSRPACWRCTGCPACDNSTEEMGYVPLCDCGAELPSWEPTCPACAGWSLADYLALVALAALWAVVLGSAAAR